MSKWEQQWNREYERERIAHDLEKLRRGHAVENALWLLSMAWLVAGWAIFILTKGRGL
jgi:hypothetical protein